VGDREGGEHHGPAANLKRRPPSTFCTREFTQRALDTTAALGTLQVMSSRLSFALFLTIALAAGLGCRQADGPMPSPTGEVPNRLGDISRDLTSIARGEAQARQDLADDLKVFVEKPTDADAAVDELARRVSQVVGGKPLRDQDAQRLAHHLWTAIAARELSERQVAALQNELQALLVSMGVPEASATTTAEQVEQVQAQVTTRPRRWYEVF
jgi:hypothetical protein